MKRRKWISILLAAVLLFQALSPLGVLAKPLPSRDTFPSASDIGTAEWYRNLSAEDRASFDHFKTTVDMLLPYMRLSPDGIPYLTISKEKAVSLGVDEVAFENIRSSMQSVESGIRSLSKDERPKVYNTANGYVISSYGKVLSPSPVSVCVTIPKWALQAFAWYVIIVGGVTATLGGFLTGATIVGLPASAVLGGLGIWVGLTGTAFLWIVDNFYQPRRICID